jgi:GNAT superfamily N-acetyltransferase
LFTWLHNNPLVEFQRIDKVFNPQIIGRNTNFITIIAARKIDLYGRIGLYVGKGNVATGPSEVLDFFNGAELSENGRSIFALTSRDPKGEPNILPSIADWPNQFSMTESVSTVVTEHGVAYLEGRTVRERALALIEVAHPDDRAKLLDEAKKRKMVYPDQIFLAESARLYPMEISTTQTFKGDTRIRFRAIKPSDEEGMRHLFYRFSDESSYYRYFHSVRTMPHEKMQEYVNVDWSRDLSIVGLVGHEGEGRIIAEGRYLGIPGSLLAELVFVVDENFQSFGIGTYLYGMLIRLAKERGLKGFMADVLFDNLAMMKVFHKGELPVRAQLESGVYHLTIPFES